MCLLVDGQLLDVGFGAATPIGPVPLGGSATYGGATWKTERVTSPEGESAWLLSMADMPLYTFTELDRHPVDFLAPNHFTSTHPSSRFTNTLVVQRWRADAVQVGLVGLDLLVRDPYSQSRVAPGDLQSTPCRPVRSGVRPR
jgi:N-hydroxyarylamine O-acetyltransferase